jgi:hypothetical protein
MPSLPDQEADPSNQQAGNRPSQDRQNQRGIHFSSSARLRLAEWMPKLLGLGGNRKKLKNLA